MTRASPKILLRIGRIRKRLATPSVPWFVWLGATVISLALHGVLIYSLAPWWQGWAWNRNSTPVGEMETTHEPRVVAFQVSTPPLEPAELLELLNVPQIQAPEGRSPEPAAIEATATIPSAPQIAAPWAGRRDALPPIPSSDKREADTVWAPSPAPIGGGLEGRTADARGKLASLRGGSPRSEAAVHAGLAWIVAHQHSDGGWRFTHRGGPCDGRCRNSGSENSTTAATALALLPLLGAGHTPVDGEHASAVAHGLAYLRGRMVVSSRGGDLQEGTMYGQGLSAIALCEAYALTKDDELKQPAQKALDFIVSAQHFRGGWRYFPGQPGDTTVVGWQWMALKSGQMAGLAVPKQALDRASAFLDSVESDGGAAYGYEGRQAQRSPTAIGLLCRMYSGWRRNDPRLVRGVAQLAAWGPSYEDMYFNYYATQVLHHQEGPHWPTWNEQMREHLIAAQATTGHEAGSWHFADPHTGPGGRLCDTALALMILEVYYRHMPLYGMKSVDF
ncbi:MAG: hypothetical protein L0211_11235 [Planctomycetaceae bacterium]|nr:hypothetical protein [Planctomycetaceae bacterium]